MNLLECLCFHGHAVAAIKDASLDLMDYCARRLAALHSKAKAFREATPARDPDQSPKDFARALETRTPREELLQKLLGVFGAMQYQALSELAHQSADAVLLHVRLCLRPVT